MLGGQSDSFGKEEAHDVTSDTATSRPSSSSRSTSDQNVAGGAKEMTGAKSQEASQVEAVTCKWLKLKMQNLVQRKVKTVRQNKA